ncbi:MAG: hypothetical protein K0S33_2764 [Bacteroidetes bacterium]|jgi:hypothetical protein|nr:hypothetical protein [Bacteroidota bacterium]
MQKTSIPKNRILILEEQRIIGFDLEQQLRKRGYCVSHEKSYEDIKKTFLFGFSEIVISSAKSLRNSISPDALIPMAIRTNGLHFLNHLVSGDMHDFKTDTIVIDPCKGDVRYFEKPYKTDDIISFVNLLMQKNATISNVSSQLNK